ncbi:hypothetical protein Goari_017054 [Gossypium aridum]|uniref:DUF4283 domain-containing protein n=1 Tax=Gossypium aridum TaxID=34290 RepID=A0A7J8WLG0_GOSAI|nr:hypothetical protein [Gossypium aridum]
MEEALVDLWLTEEGDNREIEVWEFEQDEAAGEPFSDLCLVGCFLIATTINFQSMRTMMANLWHPLEGISITNVGEKRFVFQFYCEIDFDRVVKGAPWTFNNHLLVFHHLKQGEDPLEVDLLYTEFWVQIHNLPLGMFTEAIAKQFGDFIGAFMDYDVKTIAAGLRNYMQIRVKTDIRESLKQKKETYSGKKEWQKGRSFPLNEISHSKLLHRGQRQKILIEEDSKMESMEIEPSKEDRPIIVGDGKKRPRPNNAPYASPNEELMWRTGLGEDDDQTNQTAKPARQHVLKKYHPQVVFFLETKMARSRMERIRRKYGFANGVDISAQGLRRGLYLSWCSSVNVIITSFSENHIDAIVDNSDGTTK